MKEALTSKKHVEHCRCSDRAGFDARCLALRHGPTVIHKALTIWQPYAEMIIRREKLVENRTWETKYRGTLYIHAGKSRADWDQEMDDRRYPNAEFGAIVGVCRLVDCVRSADAIAGKLDEVYPWISTHMHVYGPWCWVLEGAGPIRPTVPWKGAQGLWDISNTDLESAA